MARSAVKAKKTKAARAARLASPQAAGTRTKRDPRPTGQPITVIDTAGVVPPRADPPALAAAVPAVKTKREPKNVRARMADTPIRIVAPAGAGPEWNPRKVGSNSHAYFEAMKGGITIREYLAKFTAADQRTARQWLWNTIQDGYAKTLGG